MELTVYPTGRDDAAAIQAAIDEVHAAGGGSVVLSHVPRNLSGLELPHNVTLRGGDISR